MMHGQSHSVAYARSSWTLLIGVVTYCWRLVHLSSAKHTRRLTHLTLTTEDTQPTTMHELRENVAKTTIYDCEWLHCHFIQKKIEY